MKKRMLAIVLTAAMALAMTACGSSSSENADSGTDETTEEGDTADASDDEVVIGFTIMNNVEVFCRTLQDGIEARSEELGFSLDIVSADGDAAKQTSQVEDFITNGVDAIIMHPCDSAGCGTAIEAANAAGIPIFTVDLASSTAKPTAHITTDSYSGGNQIGEWLVEKLDGAEANVVILNDNKLDSVYNRALGFEAAIEDADNVKIIEDANVGYQRDIAMKTVEDFLVAYPEMNYILACQGTDAALAANDAIAAAGKTDSIKVLAFDGFEDTMKLLKDGNSSIICDVYNDAFTMGSDAVDAVKTVLDGGEVEESTLIPVPLITDENVDEYYSQLYGE